MGGGRARKQSRRLRTNHSWLFLRYRAASQLFNETAAWESAASSRCRRTAAGPARRTLRGIDEQVAKAAKAVAGKVPVKRNRFITLTGADKSVNRALEAKARALAGWKGYITNLPAPTPELVIGASPRLFQIEKSFRMSKHDLAARPIYHHKRASIEAHLTIVFAALAVSQLTETRTDWSIRKFVHAVRRYRTVQINAAGVSFDQTCTRRECWERRLARLVGRCVPPRVVVRGPCWDRIQVFSEREPDHCADRVVTASCPAGSLADR